MTSGIARIRRALRLTQEEFAAIFEVRAQAVSRWERGQRMGWRNRERLQKLLSAEWVRQRLREAGLEVAGS